MKDYNYTSVSARRHFHTFDALRFFAFLKVFLLHLPITSFAAFNFFRAGGGFGVQFFFVLSGFLITYIICDEKQRLGQINLSNFFARRVLRIWPLYYFMVLVAFATPFILQLLDLPHSAEGYEPDWLITMLFLENYNIIAHGGVAPNVSPLAIMWSLCVEEHFYIVWGLLLFFLPLRHLPAVIVVSLIAAPVFRIVFFSLGLPTNDLFTHLDLFAFGAVPAWLLLFHPHWLDRYVDRFSLAFKRGYIIVLVAVVFAISQYAHDLEVLLWAPALLGALFSGLIILIVTSRPAIRLADSNLLSRLGVYTYGLYLYHVLVINALHQICVKYHWQYDGPILNSIAFVTLSFLLTVVLAYASYHLFEKQFLKLKKFFRPATQAPVAEVTHI